MRRAIYIGLLSLICAVPAQVWAQGHGKGGGGGNKAAHVQGGQQGQGGKQQVSKQQIPGKQQAHANKTAQQQQGGRAAVRKQPQRAAAQKQESGRSPHVAAGKTSRDRQAASRSVERRGSNYDVRTVRRDPSGLSGRERAALGSVSYVLARQIRNDAYVIRDVGDRVHVRNRAGNVLLDMDRDRVRNIGYWDVRPVRYDVRKGAPAFCRSGAGHPVWGREWCLEKGFGLGRYNDIGWGRTTSIGDIIFGRRYVDRQTLLRDALIASLGSVVLDRLGLHSLTLGYTEPLTGVWVAEPAGPQVLLINSGTYPVAEVYDWDRDNRADVMLVALRSR